MRKQPLWFVGLSGLIMKALPALIEWWIWLILLELWRCNILVDPKSIRALRDLLDPHVPSILPASNRLQWSFSLSTLCLNGISAGVSAGCPRRSHKLITWNEDIVRTNPPPAAGSHWDHKAFGGWRRTESGEGRTSGEIGSTPWL